MRQVSARSSAREKRRHDHGGARRQFADRQRPQEEHFLQQTSQVYKKPIPPRTIHVAELTGRLQPQARWGVGQRTMGRRIPRTPSRRPHGLFDQSVYHLALPKEHARRGRLPNVPEPAERANTPSLLRRVGTFSFATNLDKCTA